MGKAWARTLNAHPDVEIAGWVDLKEDAAAEAAQELEIQVAHLGQNYVGALSDLKPDFIVDVTPPEVHHDVTLMALAEGVAVLGEKPMAISLAQAQRMVKASEEAGKLYMVSQSRRYDGRIQGYRGLVSQLGVLGILNADFYIGAHFGGFRDEMPSPLVLDMAIHTFDAARYICDSDPKYVYAEEYNPGWSWYQGDACATAIFEMENGVRFTYRGSWCAEGLPTSWESSWRAVGERGTALWDGHDSLQAEVVQATGGFHSEMSPLVGSPSDVKHGIEGSLEDFLHALRTGETPMGECHDNIKSLAMVFSAMESSAGGRSVKVEF